MAQKYQHRIPQDTDHTVRPDPDHPRKCARCGLAIKPVKDNEGPESLKSLFRF